MTLIKTNRNLFLMGLISVVLFQLFYEPIHYDLPEPRFKYSYEESYTSLSKFTQRAFFHDGFVYYECSEPVRELNYFHIMTLEGNNVDSLDYSGELAGIYELPNNSLLLIDEFYNHKRCLPIIYNLETQQPDSDYSNIFVSLVVLNNKIYGFQQHGTGFRSFSQDFKNHELISEKNEYKHCLQVYRNNIYALDNQIRDKESIFDKQSDLYIYSFSKKEFIVICENGIDYFINDKEIFYIDNLTKTIKRKEYYTSETITLSDKKVENMCIQGDYIYFMTCENGLLHDNNFLYRMKLDGSNCHEICKYEENYFPHFYNGVGYYISQNYLMSVSPNGNKKNLKKIKWGGKVETVKPYGIYYYEECDCLMKGETFKVFPIH